MRTHRWEYTYEKSVPLPRNPHYRCYVIVKHNGTPICTLYQHREQGKNRWSLYRGEHPDTEYVMTYANYKSAESGVYLMRNYR